VVHGPTPRDDEIRLSKRTRRQALLSVLTDKRTHGKLMVVNAITAEGNKTRNLVAWLRERGIGEGESALLVLAPGEEGVARAARNIEGVITLPVCGVNVYDLLRYGYVVCTPESLGLLQKRLRTPEKGEVSEAAA
jgi:large subunit ribosomal protein L4